MRGKHKSSLKKDRVVWATPEHDLDMKPRLSETSCEHEYRNTLKEQAADGVKAEMILNDSETIIYSLFQFNPTAVGPYTVGPYAVGPCPLGCGPVFV